MLRYAVLALGCLALSAAAARAQVVYEPLRSQYQTPAGQPYFYGGVDPRVHAIATSDASYGDRCGFHGYAMNLHHFDGGNSFGQPMPMYERTPVFTDCVPGRDASRLRLHGGRREQRGPRQCADLLPQDRPAGQRDPDGDRRMGRSGERAVRLRRARYDARRRHVCASGDRPPRRRPTPAARGQILIIPKNLMDRKVKDFDQKPLKVASAK
jgi:hypothetical protein